MFALQQDTRRMRAMDIINTHAGKRILRLGAEGFDPKAKMTQDQLSPAYLTNRADLPTTHGQ